MRKHDILTLHRELAQVRQSLQQRGASAALWRKYDELRIAPNTVGDTKGRHALAVLYLAQGIKIATREADACG